MKKFLSLAALLTLFNGFSTEPRPFGTLMLNGGRLEPVEMSMIEASNEHLNFCFATRFPDNSIYLNHSAGIHTVSEYGCRDYSLDNGKTWRKMPFDFGGFNAYQDRTGRKITVQCWDDQVSATHTLTRRILGSDGKSVTLEKFTLKLPFESTFRLHREILRLKDGRLLLTGYGRKKDAPKFFSFVLSSSDDGASWEYLSTILEDPAAKWQEGPNECAVIELANGDILAYVRVAGNAPLLQLRSTDGGRSWGKPEEIARFCVAPAARILKNGALVVITGRPKLYLLIDFTGTGKHYQRCQIYGGSGSSYASVLEIAPNRIMVIYDESDFGAWRNLGIFSRIMAMTLDVVRDDSARFIEATSPEAAKYEQFYFAGTGQLPEAGRLFMPSSFQPASKDTYYEIRKIAERPHPVLHLELKGKTAPRKFAHFSGATASGCTSIDAGFEFRLTEAAEKNPQFAIRFCFDARGGENQYGWIAFGVNQILYRSAGKLKTFPCVLGTNFHAFEMKAGLSTGTYQLFVRDSKKPLFTAELTRDPAISPGFTWGDGASNVTGGVDLSYIGINSGN